MSPSGRLLSSVALPPKRLSRLVADVDRQAVEEATGGLGTARSASLSMSETRGCRQLFRGVENHWVS
jgi:hypothetical protein